MVALANVALTDTFDTWRIRTNQIIVKGNEDELSTEAAFAKANTANITAELGYNKANAANVLALAAFNQANSAYVIGNSAFDKANSANIIAALGYNKANAANVLAYDTGIGANAFTSATIAGANAAVGTGANSYASAVGTGANSYILSVIAGANTAVGAGANAYSASIANTISIAAFAKANASVQNNSTTLITTGYSVSTYNAGANVAAYSTWIPDPANSNYQYATSNGAFTLAAPTNNCAIDILLTNGVNAKSITFSGFTVDANNVGDVYNTTNTNRFIIMIRKINNVSTYIIKALQA
jgi:hypothetical protein